MSWFSRLRNPVTGRESSSARQKHRTREPNAARMPPGAVELSYLEKKVLLALGKLQKAPPEELRAAGKFHELVEVMNAASWLQAKGLVTMKERVVHSYRLARPEVAKRQLPERKALKAAIKAGGPIEGGRLKAACQVYDAALAVAPGGRRGKGWG